MHAAAQMLLGRHDFSAYRAASCQAESPIRTLERLDVIRQGEEIHILASARSFLHHQIRNFAGTLYEVGLGRRPVTWPRAVLDGRDRKQAGQTAPPQGLTFMQVDYAEPINWA
jgi:tRNA pseudouridine38-40 synthase